jgi:glycosyltransferase involved in cell wall biosynthesis
MTKILIITNYLGNLGGLGRYSQEVVRALKVLPIDIKVMTEVQNLPTQSEQNILKPVFNQSKINLIRNLFYNCFAVRRMAKDFDIIHACDGWPYGVYGWFAVLGTNKKLFITGIGTYTIAPLKELIRGTLLRFTYKRAQKIFCISDFVLSKLKKRVPEAKAETVLMGTTELPHAPVGKAQLLTEQYNLKNFHPIILTVGDIKNRKGQLDTLRALNLIKNKYPDLLYIMIGDDVDRYYIDQIEQFAKNNNLEKNILIISKMYDDEVLSFFYSVCDIFMLNSNNEGEHFEGFGLVLLEAAQFGKPVIGSSNCGIESAISNCYNGFLTEQGNHEEIGQKIVSILEADKDKFGSNSLEFYKHFSWEKTAKKYYESYLN